MTSLSRKNWLRWLAWPAMLLILLAVFALYTQPDFMVMLANQVWACF
jgi:hypothetical protein